MGESEIQGWVNRHWEVAAAMLESGAMDETGEWQLSLSQTQSGWRLIENWAMLLPDVGFVQTDLWNGDGPAAVASSA
jgi:hypothetical protein